MSASLASAYASLPPLAQDVVLSAYGFRLRWLRYGPGHRHFLDGLRQSQWLTPGEIAELQLAALDSIVAIARETVPLYWQRLPPGPIGSLDRLRDLPFLSKDQLRAGRDHLVSTTHARRRLVEVHTGGTTGTPLTIYADRQVLRHNYAFFARFLEWTGAGPRPRTATFAGRTIVPAAQARPPFWRHNLAARTLLFSSYHLSPATLPGYAAALAEFRPELIDAYPSSLLPVARYILDHGGPEVRPRAVVTSSETLTAEARDAITAAFHAPVYDHYGAAEMAAFITQCEAGSYHPNPEFGIVEVLVDGRPARPGEPGEIVATGFINPVMPLIRYRTGDLAVPAAGPCPCGRAFPRLDRVEGRRDDVLTTPDGRWIGRLDPVFKSARSLRETRIVQDAPDHVQVEYVAERPLGREEADTLLLELRARLGPAMRVDLARVPQLPRTSAGKLRAVVNLTSVTASRA